MPRNSLVAECDTDDSPAFKKKKKVRHSFMPLNKGYHIHHLAIKSMWFDQNHHNSYLIDANMTD